MCSRWVYDVTAKVEIANTRTQVAISVCNFRELQIFHSPELLLYALGVHLFILIVCRESLWAMSLCSVSATPALLGLWKLECHPSVCVVTFFSSRCLTMSSMSLLALWTVCAVDCGAAWNAWSVFFAASIKEKNTHGYILYVLGGILPADRSACLNILYV